MADYAVTFARSARKELEVLPHQLADRVLAKIETLAVEPRPVGSLKLHGGRNHWRVRVGDYRVVYSVNDSTRVVDISIIRHRRDVYRDL